VPEHLHSSTLFRTSLVTVSDWRCRPTSTAFGEEEESSGHVLVFPRTGLFVERRSGRNAIADCTRVHFFNRNETYQVAHPVAGGDDCTSIRFDDDALIDLLAHDDPSVADRPSPFRLSSAGTTAVMALVLHRLRRNLLAERAIDALLIEEDAAFLLTEASTIANRLKGRAPQPRRPATRKAHRELVHTARLVLAKTFREKVTLSGLARAVFSSPFHLARVYRREAGLSIHAQLNRLRLRGALQEIADGMPDLTKLALDLGFSSHAHFTEAFAREFGDTPSRVRGSLWSAKLRKASRNLEADAITGF
jgi:AraC family transcriptional regulator